MLGPTSPVGKTTAGGSEIKGRAASVSLVMQGVISSPRPQLAEASVWAGLRAESRRDPWPGPTSGGHSSMEVGAEPHILPFPTPPSHPSPACLPLPCSPARDKAQETPTQTPWASFTSFHLPSQEMPTLQVSWVRKASGGRNASRGHIGFLVHGYGRVDCVSLGVEPCLSQGL